MLLTSIVGVPFVVGLLRLFARRRGLLEVLNSRDATERAFAHNAKARERRFSSSEAVAQNCILLDCRFLICRSDEIGARPESTRALLNAIRRYSRLKICATSLEALCC
jgi:hypothetical protein